MASTDAKHIPVKNSAYRVTFPIFDADGDLVTGATGLDSEVSIDAGAFADCTNEATEIATSSGMYYLDLTAAEMNGDTIAVIVKTSSSGAKTTPLVLYTAARSVNDLAYPTVSGRSLDVSAGGEAGVDWANVGSPTTTLNLSGTTIKTATDVETDTQDIQSRLPAALGANGNLKADVRDFNGTAGTFASGRPEVNTTQWKGATPADLTANGYLQAALLRWLTDNAAGTPTGLLSGGFVKVDVERAGGLIASTAFAGYAEDGIIPHISLLARKDAALATDLSTYLDRINSDYGSGAGSYDLTTDSLQAQRDNLGTNGAALTLAKTTNLTGLNDLDAAGVRAAVGLASANLDTQLDALPTAAENADAVWDEVLSAHNTEDSVGNVLNDLTDEDAGGVYQFTINALENGPSGSGGGSSAADIWAYATRTLTQAAASVLAAVTGSSITVYRGTTWSITLTGLPILTAYDTVYFSVKEKLSDPDTAAWLRVKNGASGLQRFMTDAPSSASNGTLTTPTSTSVTITIQEEETVRAILKSGLYYDLKGVDNDGNVDLLSAGGTFTIAGDVTRAIT